MVQHAAAQPRELVAARSSLVRRAWLTHHKFQLPDDGCGRGSSETLRTQFYRVPDVRPRSARARGDARPRDPAGRCGPSRCFPWAPTVPRRPSSMASAWGSFIGGTRRPRRRLRLYEAERVPVTSRPGGLQSLRRPGTGGRRGLGAGTERILPNIEDVISSARSWRAIGVLLRGDGRVFSAVIGYRIGTACRQTRSAASCMSHARR